MKTSALAAVLVLAAGVATPAAAGPLREALDRHGAKDVEALRAQAGDAAARCTLGAVYGKRGDLARASLYLTGCDDAALPDDIAADIARARRDVKKQVEASELALVEIVTYPEHMVGDIAALPGETFATPATLYVKPGTHAVHATKDGIALANTVTVQKHGRALVLLGSPGTQVVTPPRKDAHVDFREEAGAETQHAGPPPDVKRGSILGGTKYDKGMKATAAADNPDGLQDPLAAHDEARPIGVRPYWLGVRFGGGVFDDGATAARPGVAVAAAGRLTLAGPVFLAGRLDWSRRGGDTADRIDVLGASAGLGRVVLDTRAVQIAVLGQLRGELRLAGERMTAPVHRAGLAAAAGLDFALPRTPFTAGLRFEQGLTSLVPGARDRAALFELGLDWR